MMYQGVNVEGLEAYDALIQAVGFICVRFCVIDCRRELACGIPGESCRAITERIAGSIIAQGLKLVLSDWLMGRSQRIMFNAFCNILNSRPVPVLRTTSLTTDGF